MGGAAIIWFMIANIDRQGEAPLFLLPFLVVPLAWWGTRRAHSWKQGACLGLITIGTPVLGVEVFLAYVVTAWRGRLDWEFARIAVTQFGPTLIVGAIVGALIGAFNQKKLS